VIFLHDITEELRTQQLRRQFVANASHELKTPVASLQTLVEAIRGSLNEDPVAAARFAEQMEKEGRRMAALIDDLMDLSRVEDPAAMRLGEANLSVLISEEVTNARELASNNRIELEAEIEGGLRVRGDDQHLNLMVRNLIENAIRYTPEGGQVTVRLGRTDGWAQLQVIDTGVGIPLQAQARVFERFYRVDEDRARLSGGTGLGLSIVKNVAESHGGAVAVTSELDEGSTFTVTLPLLQGGS
jgi:two-component system sensor histidine kinase SenX3